MPSPTLPLSIIFPTTVSITPAGSPGLTFNQALIVGSSNVIPTVGVGNIRLRQYTSLNGLLQDGFSSTSPEYLAASVYFDQSPQPTFVWIGRQDKTAIAAMNIHAGSTGTGYYVNDVVTVTQSGASGGQAQVMSLTGGNSATTATLVSGHAGTGYTTAPSIPTTGGSGTGLTVDITAGGIDTAKPTSGAGGTGYLVNDVVGVANGVGGQLTVLAVDASGVVLSLGVKSGKQGSGYTTGSNTSTTGGTGTGLLVDITAAALSGAVIHAAGGGSGYAVNDVVTVVQAGASGGQLKITAINPAGSVATIQMIPGGQGSGYSAANSLSVTGGHGTGLQVDITGVGESPLQAVQACRLGQPSWYTCMFVGAATVADHVAIAGFLEGATPPSQYFCTSSEAGVPSGDVSTLPGQMMAMNFRRTNVTYSTPQGGQYPNNVYACAAPMGYAMGANSGAPASAFALAYKSMVGIPAELLTQTQASNVCGSADGSITGLRCNMVADFQNGSYPALFIYGRNSSGNWFDEILQLDMLISDIQTSCMNLFTSQPKIPITDTGVTMVKTVMAACLERSKQRGFIAPAGTWQGVNVGYGAGAIKTGDAFPLGYDIFTPPVATLSQGQRVNRQLPATTICLIESGGAVYMAINLLVQA